jgi:enoyl-CoA hydratase
VSSVVKRFPRFPFVHTLPSALAKGLGVGGGCGTLAADVVHGEFMAMADTLVLTERFEGWAKLTLNRPKANALSLELVTGLRQAVDTLLADRQVRCIVITGGEGRFFSAGADIPTLKRSMGGSPAGSELLPEGLRLMDTVAASPVPVVAAVNGVAVGGGFELCLACHLRIAADTAQFGLPEVTLGIIPGWGGTHRLPRVVGEARALEWMLTGRMVSAEEAAQAGLLAKVVPAAELPQAAAELASTLAARPPIAVRAILRAVQGRAVDPAQGPALEQEGFREATRSKDAVEGVAAFLEKRRPQFMGE